MLCRIHYTHPPAWSSEGATYYFVTPFGVPGDGNYCTEASREECARASLTVSASYHGGRCWAGGDRIARCPCNYNCPTGFIPPSVPPVVTWGGCQSTTSGCCPGCSAISCNPTGYTGTAGSCTCETGYWGTVTYSNGAPAGCTGRQNRGFCNPLKHDTKPL